MVLFRIPKRGCGLCKVRRIRSQVNGSRRAHGRAVLQTRGNVGQEVVLDSRALKWYNGGDKEICYANDDER